MHFLLAYIKTHGREKKIKKSLLTVWIVELLSITANTYIVEKDSEGLKINKLLINMILLLDNLVLHLINQITQPILDLCVSYTRFKIF